MDRNEFIGMSDRDLVARLLENDQDAWSYLLLDVIAPITRIRKYTEILAKNSIPAEAVLSRVWMILSANDFRRLRNFRFAASLKTYMAFIVREAHRAEVREKIGKIPLVLSEVDSYASLIAGRDSSNDYELRDEIADKNALYRQLWDANSQQAFVFLLRFSLGLSSAEVGSLLDLSVSNVDQLKKRAKDKLTSLMKGRD